MKIIDKFIEAINYTKSQGFIIVNEGWGYEDEKCADALGSLLYFNKKNYQDIDAYYFIEQILSVSDKWIDAFTAGFDDNPWDLKILLSKEDFETMPDSDKKELEDAFNMGVSLREKYKPIKYDAFSKAWLKCDK